ncbi:aminotransferase-like domain-containing protein [Daejeonella lutea]|uniref:GntR family transcriptional regulator / MocR family aminotransferase n=1 Tax=Daejeonella lutea TaxID=572036 RepID=A0A1T5CWJ8_9SPHI|nr:PLP-dependent aminotransferase family protein [Daejeonella lutea]SKB63895.1 GntR family transcriptional regulator / MocR family aminotransferase [Daejeonella lutea]
MAVQTLPYNNLIHIDRRLDIPVFKQVADGFIKLIENKKLKPGVELPSTRQLAQMLKLNRSTTVAAYDQLNIMGWIVTSPRKAVLVAHKLPIITPQSFNENVNKNDSNPFYNQINTVKSDILSRPYHLVINDGYPDARIAPLQILADTYKSLQGKYYKHIGIISEPSIGSTLLRTELASFLTQTRGLDITEDHILTTRGAQGAIFIAAQMIVKPGSKVIVGDLNYRMANKVFEQLGGDLIKVKVDENGIDVDQIEELCRTERPDLIYLIPHHHHPTTVTLSAERRRKLLMLIKEYTIPLIEDDYDYDYHYESSPILPLASSDHDGLVIYIGSISKVLSLTIRSGFLISQPDFIWQAGKYKELMETRGDLLLEESIGHLFQSGEMQKHINKSLKLYKSRRDSISQMLSTRLNGLVHFTIPLGGMAIWSIFDASVSLSKISKRLSSQGIYLNDGSFYNQGNDSLNGVRIGFASMDESETDEFIDAVVGCIDSGKV